jgi:hypothetical protein
LMGMLDFETAQRILSVQDRLGLPIARSAMTVDMLAQGIRDARKHRGGRLRMPVIRAIGDAIFIDEVSDAMLAEALALIQSWPVAKTIVRRRPMETSPLPPFGESAKRPSTGMESPSWGLRSSALGRADA